MSKPGAVRFIYNSGLVTINQSYQNRKATTSEREWVNGALRPLELQALLPALKLTFPWLAGRKPRVATRTGSGAVEGRQVR